MTYLNLKHLAKYPTRYINNALLKSGHLGFNLYILEYCDVNDLIATISNNTFLIY